MNLSPDVPLAGVLCPLFALRSEEDLGIGDVKALRGFARWARAYGFRLVQLLPINETGNDNSPYNAISSIAIDPATLALSPRELPDLTEEDYQAVLAETDLHALRSGPVQYHLVKPLKRRLLEKAFEQFWKLHGTRSSSKRGNAFLDWVEEQGSWIGEYSLFRALMDENGGSEVWDRWPEEQQTLERARQWLAAQPRTYRLEFEQKRRFFEYVQWVAFSQWQALKQECEAMGVALMGDVPIGVSYYGADVFAHPEIFNLKWSGGAPPERVFKSDPFTEKWGQNWGVPMYRWDRLEANNFGWWRERVLRVRSIFHLFRIDHVLGFYRMYGFPWRPERNAHFLPLSEEEARRETGGELPHFIPRDDSTWENREANRRDGERYLRALLEEVGEHRLIGEDLGVVPDYVRPSLTSMGIAGFKIPQWERGEHGRLIPGRDYQRLSVVTYATHDHPPLAVFWRQMSDAAAAGDGHQRWELEQFAAFAGLRVYGPHPFTPEVHEALLRALFESNSWLAIVMVTDLFGSEQRFNVPGAVAASNWSERLAHSPREWETDAQVKAWMERVAALVRAGGRA